MNATAEGAVFQVRPGCSADIQAIIEIDADVTGVAKERYWRELIDRYLSRRTEDRFVLVAECEGEVIGFLLAEIRAWEFGSEPCGWVFAISVSPSRRLAGVGTGLIAAIVEKFRIAGIKTVRTMLSRRNHVLMAFFRSQGMMAGPYIQLEKAIDDGADG